MAGLPRGAEKGRNEDVGAHLTKGLHVVCRTPARNDRVTQQAAFTHDTDKAAAPSNLKQDKE